MANPLYKQAARHMEISTPLGPDVLLLAGFTGKEGISQLFRFQLDLLAENEREIAFDKLLGQKATIRLALSATKNRFINGIVNRLSQGMRDDTFTNYKVELVPHFWLLTRRVQSRIFQHVAVPDILKQVLQGLDVSFELQDTFHPRDYCVQYRESDFDFASRLMEEEGIFYFFKHTADGHKMILGNTPQNHPDLPEQSTINFEQTKGGTRARCRITDWEKVQEVRSGKVTLRDHSFELPDKHLEANKTIADSVAVGKVTHKLKVANNEQLEIYDYPGGYAHRFAGIDRGGSERPAELQKIFEDNQRTAAIRMQQEALPGLTIQGGSYCRQLVSGYKFTLARHFNADGPYVLTNVEHTVRFVGDFRSGEGVAFAYQNRFTCVPFALPFRPARTTPKPRMQGTQTAVVVGPPGEHVFTDKYGRVKVQFHWDRQGQLDANSSCWARVGSVWAGKRRGVIYIPMVGDEVIVDFLEGDPDQPIIVGSVYNAEMMPPFPLPESKEVSGYKGRTGSNYLKQQDVAGMEVYHLNAQKNLAMTVGNDEAHDVKGKRQTSIGKDDELTVAGKRYVQAKLVHVSADNIWLVGNQEVMLTVKGNIIRIDEGGISINGKLVRINC